MEEGLVTGAVPCKLEVVKDCGDELDDGKVELLRGAVP